ncbi:YetF domain-containing protein, partial [Klebsiella aerogenes]
NGVVADDKMKMVNISVDDILLAARQHHGIYQLEKIKFAILERNGQISIIPTEA